MLFFPSFADFSLDFSSKPYPTFFGYPLEIDLVLFEKAYERILTEFQIILNLSLEDTQKKLDKALKRNLEKSQQNLEKKAPINPQPTEDTEEPENLENVSEEE